MLVIMVRVQQSTKKQEKYFGSFGWRPYLNIRLENPNLFSEELIKHVIFKSFYDEPIKGVEYDKYFDLEENDAFDFDYAIKYWDDSIKRFRFSKYRRISL